MTLQEWCEKYRVKMTRGTQGCEDLAEGKYGEIADAYRDGRLRLRLLAVPRDADMNKSLASRRRQAEAGGLKLIHTSGYESVFGFSPDDDTHSRLAIDLVRPKRRRTVTLTDDQRAVLAARLAAARAARSELTA